MNASSMKSGYHLLLFLVLCGCNSIPVSERSDVRNQINTDADEIIARLIAEEPEFQKRYDASVGYFASRLSGAKGPIVGGGYGIGVLYDKETGSRTYMNINRVDFGVGWASSRFSAGILFESREALENFRDGKWISGVGADSAYGTHGIDGSLAYSKGYSIHVLSDSGGGTTLSARLVRLSVNEDLTGSGVSEVSIPNRNFKSIDDPGDSASRIWEQKMPFFAQNVIDKGYDLPLPYGIGIVYANVTQEMFLTDLNVGINGKDKEPFGFISFDNETAKSSTVQAKLDTWIFPFLNVFGMLGSISGNAPVDVLLDGNEMIDHLEIGPLNPLYTRLKDKEVNVPVTANFSGITYGLGAVLAGGWNNWFFAIPGSVNYADMNGRSIDGLVYTVTPRFGRVFNLGKRGGNLALFLGGNYLKADLTVMGQGSVDGLTIEYTIDQENSDPWNLLAGFNWDFNKHLSWSLEYDGFTGSREAVITSVVFRY